MRRLYVNVVRVKFKTLFENYIESLTRISHSIEKEKKKCGNIGGRLGSENYVTKIEKKVKKGFIFQNLNFFEVYFIILRSLSVIYAAEENSAS